MNHVLKAMLGAAFLASSSVGSLAADPCTALIERAETGLKQQGIDSASKSELELLLEVGRGGDVAACTAATTGSLQSPKPAGHRCEKSLNSV